MPIFKEGRKSDALSKEQWDEGSSLIIRVALLGTTYNATGRENADLTWSQISSHETTGAAGYSQQTLGGKVLEEDDPNDRTWFNGQDVTFAITATSGAARYAAILKWDTGTNGNSEILRVIDLRPLNNGNDVAFVDANVVLRWVDGHVFGRRVE